VEDDFTARFGLLAFLGDGFDEVGHGLEDGELG
jgi:hypothetical protein